MKTGRTKAQGAGYTNKPDEVEKTSVRFVFTFLFAALVFASCSGGLKDGVYTGRSGKDDLGAFGEITITVSGGAVTGCSYVTRQKDLSIKDENYGKVNGEISNRDFYEKAQLAVRAMETYAKVYAETGKLDQVDVISGATIAWNQFMEAAVEALGSAGRREE